MFYNNNNYLIKILYNLALMIEQITGINIEYLAPDRKEINTYLKQSIFSQLILRKINKNRINPKKKILISIFMFKIYSTFN